MICSETEDLGKKKKKETDRYGRQADFSVASVLHTCAKGTPTPKETVSNRPAAEVKHEAWNGGIQ